MAAGAPKDMGASVRARLRALAGKRGDDFEFLLGRYAVEGLLRRISASPHRDRFILKGAILFVLWGLDGHRVTRDVDFLGVGSLSPDSLRDIFREVLAAKVPPDGLVFMPETVEATPIREETEYGGTRVRMIVVLAKAEVVVQVDVGVGDAAQGCAMVAFPTLLGGASPRLRAYLKEHSIAEKFHAIVELGGRNSRMKDFYDIHVLSGEFAFDLQDIAHAIEATFSRRSRALPSVTPYGLTAEFSGDAMKRQQWTAFHKKARVRSAIPPFEDVVASLEAFLMPAAIEARDPTGRSSRWEPAARQWRG